MSDAVRNYSQSNRGGYASPRSRGGWFRRIFAAVLVAGLFWLYWTTRDTYPIERLVPKDQAFHLQAEHLLSSRMKVAASPLWDIGLVPEEYRSMPEWLGNDFGLPDWVLNNLVSDVCHVSGTDFNTFSDLIVVTRMSRIGCLIERYHRFVDGIEDEYAGGLHLRRMADSEMYYAVRGRTLVLSPSRDALIGCLSQRTEDAVESLEHVVAATGGDVQGKAALPEDNPLGRYFERADFALTFSPTSITFAGRGEVRPVWRASLDRLAQSPGGAAPRVPATGCVAIAGAFGAPLPEVWRVADEMAGGALGEFFSDWPILQHLPDGDSPWRTFADSMAGGLPPSFYLRWTGFDLDGVVPLPEVELAFLSGRNGLQGVLEGVPPLENGQVPEDARPYRDPDTGVVHCPIGWGGILEPVVGPTPDGVRVALHPSHLPHLPPPALSQAPSAEPGQVFVRIRPAELLTVLREGGGPYARAGVLRGHTEESFDAAMAAALEGIQEVSEARLTARYDDGALFVELVVELGAGS